MTRGRRGEAAGAQRPDHRPHSEETLTLETVPAIGTNVININHRKPELADVRVQQALSMAMNREEILQVAGSGVGVVAGPIPPTHALYSVPTSVLAFYQQDVEGARALLAEAGYPDGFDLDILYIPAYPLMELSAITLAAQWQQIGIRTEPRSTEVGVWLDLRPETFDYYISTNLDFPTIDPDVYLYDTFHSTSAPAQWDAWSPGATPSWMRCSRKGTPPPTSRRDRQSSPKRRNC